MVDDTVTPDLTTVWSNAFLIVSLLKVSFFFSSVIVTRMAILGWMGIILHSVLLSEVKCIVLS
jgi:hypothetical protein